MNKLELLKLPNVVSAGDGFRPDGTDAVVVGVTTKVPLDRLEPSAVVPYTVDDGRRTDVVPVGAIHAFANTTRNRPALGGDSIGHYAITAGTLGCVVRHEGERLILSNNHVLANSNQAVLGDPILQPGPVDGGTSPNDIIAELAGFVPIVFSSPLPSDCPVAGTVVRTLNAIASAIGRQTRLQAVKPQQETNLVDAAVARPIDPMSVSDEIRGIGFITGLAEANIGTQLIKSGRTTETTLGTVLQTGVAVNVQYGAGLVATFEDQILAGPMSQPGDSGSAVLNRDNQLVGLLFAGSDQTTIFSRSTNVFAALGLHL